MYAVDTNPLAWRAITDPSQANAGEVVIGQIPDGADPSNCVWDQTLNNGSGDVRLMTPDELAAIAAEQATEVASESDVVASLDSYYAMMTATPPVTLSVTQLRNCLIGILLSLKSITGRT
jgi:hypothetical protein